jgi:predicted ATPase
VINHFASARKGSFQASRNALGEQPNRLAKTVAKYWLEENPHSWAMSVMTRPDGVFKSWAA